MMEFSSPKHTNLVRDDSILRTPTLKDLLQGGEWFDVNSPEPAKRTPISSRRKKKILQKENPQQEKENINPNKQNVSVFDYKEESTPTKGSLVGSTFVIFGNFALPKKTLKQIIKENGGKVALKIGPEVTHLLFSGSPSAEIFREAQKLGIHIVDEYFLRLVTLH